MPIDRHLFWVQRKKKKNNDKHQLVVIFFQCTKQNNKDNNEHQGSSSFSVANGKKGDPGKKCTCILAKMIGLVIQQQSLHQTQLLHQALSKH